MKRLLALLLALGLTATLAACGGNTPATPDDTAAPDAVLPSPDITQAVTLAPDPTPTMIPVEGPDATTIPDKGTPPPDAPSQDVTILHPGDPGYVTPEPTPAPPAPDPVATPQPPVATPQPSQEPAPSESTTSVTAAVLYKAWVTTSHTFPSAALSDMSSVLENFYDLDSADLEDFVLYMPAMSSSMEEIFIAKAKPGKASTVKTACQSRLEDLKEDAELYPATAGNLDIAKLETVGDWVVLAVCATPGNLVKIVQDAVK